MDALLKECYRQAVAELHEAYTPTDWRALRNAVAAALRSGQLAPERLERSL